MNLSKQSEPAEGPERQSERTGRGRPGKLTVCPGQGDDLGESGVVVGECRNGDGPDPGVVAEPVRGRGWPSRHRH